MTGGESKGRGPIAYLSGEYPRSSTTFILREVLALRRLGEEVITCSVRDVGPEQLIGPEEEAAKAETFVVLRRARNPLALLIDHARMIWASPTRYAGALALAARTARPGSRGALWQLFYFAEAAVLARHLRERGAVHLHNHFAMSSANLAMIAARMAGIPFSFTLHGPSDLFEPISWRLREKVAEARFVACISHFAKSQAMLFSNREDWGRLHVVRCGVELERYGGERPAIRGQSLSLLFVGRLAAVKGLFVLFDALKLPGAPDIRLTLIGDGPDRTALEEEARRLGLAAEFSGYRSQTFVADAMRQADAFVLPSFAEGVPVVLMEAMASGLPVIATRVGGVSELVEDGVSGFLVPPGSAMHLSSALERAAGLTENEREEMGRQGRERVEAEFRIDDAAESLVRLYPGSSENADQ